MNADTVSDAKKDKIDENAAWNHICSFKNVLIGKGKKVLKYAPSDENREEILKAAMGRSGNLRAPTIRTDDAIYIGYNDELYSTLKE